MINIYLKGKLYSILINKQIAQMDSIICSKEENWGDKGENNSCFS